jgi:hypothetical protein
MHHRLELYCLFLVESILVGNLLAGGDRLSSFFVNPVITSGARHVTDVSALLLERYTVLGYTQEQGKLVTLANPLGRYLTYSYRSREHVTL